MTDNLAQVRRYVSAATLALLGALTLASVVNLHDMALQTHAADAITAWIIALAIGATLSVLAYVASITDGRTRNVATGFAVVAALTSATLQVSLFLERGATWGVALAFGAGVPFFEVALALTDSMLRRYSVATVQQEKPATQRKPRPVATEPEPVAPVAAADVAPEPEIATIDAKQQARNMRQEGMTIEQIAAQLGRNKSTISRYLNGAAAAA